MVLGTHMLANNGERNKNGIGIIKICTAAYLAMGNTFYAKIAEQINHNQIDYILMSRSEQEQVSHETVIYRDAWDGAAMT